MENLSYKSLDEATWAFLTSCQNESNEQFQQSDIVAASCTPEALERFTEQARNAGEIASTEWLSDGDVLKTIGMVAKRAKTTMWGRLLVGRVFPPGLSNDYFPDGVRESLPPDISWSHCLACATTWDEEHPDLPYYWLREAVLNGWSVRRLKSQIALNHDIEDSSQESTFATYVLDNAEAVLDWLDSKQLTVVFPFAPQMPEGYIATPGTRVVITVATIPEFVPS